MKASELAFVFVTLATALAIPLGASPAAAATLVDPTDPTTSDPHVPDNPPPALPFPPTVRDLNRATSQLTVSWTGVVNTGEQAKLQHSTGDGTWTFLTSFSGGSNQFVHTGLPTDSQHCYRVQATNAYGSRTSSANCGYTSDGTSRKVWRAQIQLHTADVGDANTDDDIAVELNDPAGSPGGNHTWVDYGRDDFERGDTFTYDLDLDGVTFLSDITKVRISKSGDDGWCIADFSLIVNGVTVYTEDFQSLPSHCQWLDTDFASLPSYQVGHDQLRAHPSWQAYVEPSRVRLDIGAYPMVTATLGVTREETESRVEALIGDLIHGTHAVWGGHDGRAWVEATQGYHRAHMNVDLEIDVPGWFNPSLVIDFDLHYEASCSADQTAAVVEISTENLQAGVNFDWFTSLLGVILPCGPVLSEIEQQGIPDCVTYAEDYIANKVKAGFTPIVQSQRQVLPAGYRCLSADVVVDTNANVSLVYQVQAPPAVRRAPLPVLSTRPILMR